MDSKNTIAAIALSSAVIVLYSLFFAPPPNTKENMVEGNKVEQNNDTPSLDQKENVAEISREEALNQSERINFENDNTMGILKKDVEAYVDSFENESDLDNFVSGELSTAIIKALNNMPVTK